MSTRAALTLLERGSQKHGQTSSENHAHYLLRKDSLFANGLDLRSNALNPLSTSRR